MTTVTTDVTMAAAAAVAVAVEEIDSTQGNHPDSADNDQ